jgi:WD40 repeat protein
VLDSDSQAAVAISADAALLAAAVDQTVSIWEPATGTRRTTLPTMIGGGAMAFSADNTHLALGSAADGGVVEIWDLAPDPPRSRTLDTRRDATSALALSPHGTLLASAAVDDLTVQIWDLASSATRALLQGHSGRLTAVTFSPRGTLIATASADGTARIWRTATGENTAVLRGHGSALNAVAFSPDGALLATASADGTARIWDAVTAASQATFIPLPGHGYVTVCADGYKLDGNPADHLWWAIKLCRFAPGELDPFVPGLRRLPAGAPILRRPGRPGPVPASEPGP